MSRPDEGLIHQWLDGECTPEESARIERLVATDADWTAAVAEARGLIAASSRILGALDAVPHAMPQGSTAAAPAPAQAAGRAPRGGPRLRMPVWMRVAAGLVLVAGSAYVLREQSTEPFTSSPTAGELPAATPAESTTRQAASTDARTRPTSDDVVVTTDPRAIVPPATVPPLSPTPTMPAPPPPTAGAGAAVEVARAERARTLEARRIADAPRAAVLRQAETAPAPAATAAVLPKLDGCWRVSAPPELVGLLEAPTILSASGDTLVLVTPHGNVTVTRSGDTLRGGLQAMRESCGTP
ncbi:MAG TPA: hypothetical protein PLY94_00630 [Gemmatimonadaceae bacterium]|nr:hypothetical protein [Gemmatimonadaceae bacterium]